AAQTLARSPRVYGEPERVVALRLPWLGAVSDHQHTLRAAVGPLGTTGYDTLYPRRYAPRLQRSRARLVGRAVLRSAHSRESRRLHDQRLECHHLPSTAARAR